MKLRTPLFAQNRAAVVAASLVLTGGLVAGVCTLAASPRQQTPAAAASPTPAMEAVSKPATPAATAPVSHSNEMGRFPIVMYHSVGESMSGRIAALSERMGLNISTDTFRKQLDMMWKAGWYPVNMRDALSARIDVPKGKTPVVLTFDDARKSQFRYLKDGRIDPNCVVGLLMAFHEKHPDDWPLKATFYVLPESQYNPAPFGQKGLETKKLRFLQEQGMEIANHSTTHHPMRNMSAKQLEWEMAECVRYVRARVPNAPMDTMALPYGIAPRDKALWNVLLTDGPNGSPVYHNRCILLAGGNPSYPPIDSRFDRKQVMRVGVSPGELEGWIRSLKHSTTCAWPAYVSDGDLETVTVPASFVKRVDKGRLEGAHLVVYDDLPKPKKKPISTKTKVAKATAHSGV